MLPLLSLVAIVLVWAITVGIAQVRVVDAARDAARVVARGDDATAAAEAARRTAGKAADVDIERAAGVVSVSVTERVRPPGWLLIPLPAVSVRGHAVVEAEDAPTGS